MIYFSFLDAALAKWPTTITASDVNTRIQKYLENAKKRKNRRPNLNNTF